MPLMLTDVTGFSELLSNDSNLTEADVAVAVAWFLSMQADTKDTTLGEICEFLERNHIRPSVNRSRLRSNLRPRKDISIDARNRVVVPLRFRAALTTSYGAFLSAPAPKISDKVLVASEFDSDRPYIRKLVDQINASRQFGILDGCAVLMRRLMEVLIIEAFEREGLASAIMSGGEYLPLSGLIGRTTNGQEFKLSRGAPRRLETCKAIGDNAAHSRNYITKTIDIDDFSLEYRNMIEELRLLKRRN